MMLIPCPWCGPRNETEFHYGGEAGVAYPADPAALSDDEWARFLYVRSNPKGLFHERWSHSAGCRQWFTLVRDTVTHEISPREGHVPEIQVPEIQVPEIQVPELHVPELQPPGAPA